ncbi:hypothetical protein C2845_PM15G18280 [Panicum miliaceum]|uniref:Uncharacterized protein n=1 Tax=Panicum miliaceum TaxID=4540 RepID=A0A3L6Q3Q2_PANMI|nr:hypothetical protein C2845_PM15G18280 [Panicum miliaceum]
MGESSTFHLNSRSNIPSHHRQIITATRVLLILLYLMPWVCLHIKHSGGSSEAKGLQILHLLSQGENMVSMKAAVVTGILKVVSNKLAPLVIKEYSARRPGKSKTSRSGLLKL